MIKGHHHTFSMINHGNASLLSILLIMILFIDSTDVSIFVEGHIMYLHDIEV